jgi:hypothetical protein
MIVSCHPDTRKRSECQLSQWCNASSGIVANGGNGPKAEARLTGENGTFSPFCDQPKRVRS